MGSDMKYILLRWMREEGEGGRRRGKKDWIVGGEVKRDVGWLGRKGGLLMKEG